MKLKTLFPKSFLVKILLFLISIFFSLLLSETVLQIYERMGHYYVLEPNIKRVFHPLEEVMPGIQGEKEYTINQYGIRGDDFSDDQKYRILAMGGSTTECLYLDDSEAWPYLTQVILRDQGYQVWVGNIGKSGMRLGNHITDIRRLLTQYPPIDAVVALVGINDLLSALSNARASAKTATIKNTALWRFTRKIYYKYLLQGQEIVQDRSGAVYEKWRENRQQAKKIHEIPDLSSHLFDYKVQLNEFIDVARKNRIRVILMTQPTMWREHITLEDKKLLWSGWAGHDQITSDKYYSVSILMQGMKRYNQTLLEVCSEREIECIDLAAKTEKNKSQFYDDCHFNETGSNNVAQILANYLLKKPLPESISPLSQS